MYNVICIILGSISFSVHISKFKQSSDLVGWVGVSKMMACSKWKLETGFKSIRSLSELRNLYGKMCSPVLVYGYEFFSFSFSQDLCWMKFCLSWLNVLVGIESAKNF